MVVLAFGYPYFGFCSFSYATEERGWTSAYFAMLNHRQDLLAFWLDRSDLSSLALSARRC